MTATLGPPRSRVRSWFADHGLDLAIGLVVVAAGIVLRRWVLSGPMGVADLDESTVGVQALRFDHGHLAVFFPNQPYGGTVEPYLVSIVFRFVGATVVALKSVPMACACAAAALTWRVAIHLELGRAGRWVAPILVWLGPAFAVAFSTKERGFYGVALLLSTAILLLVLRLEEEPTAGDLIVLGLVVGLAWWQTPLTMLVAVPAIAWLVVRRPRLVLSDWTPYAMLVVGGLPWFVWNARNHWVSMNGGYAFGTSWWQREQGWLDKLRVVTGIETPFVATRHLVGGRWTGALIVAIVVVAATWRTRKAAPGFLAVVVVGYGLLYALNGLAAGVGGDPRYTYLLVPALALAAASLLPDLLSDLWSAAVVVVAGTIVVAMTAWGLAGMDTAARRPDADKFLASPGIEQVAEILDHAHRGPAITDIAGMQITFLTKERVKASSFSVVRYRDLELAARAAPRSTYVLDDHALDNAGRLRLYLRFEHIPYRSLHVGKWWVFFIDARVLPEQAHLLIFQLDLSPQAPTCHVTSLFRCLGGSTGR